MHSDLESIQFAVRYGDIFPKINLKFAIFEFFTTGWKVLLIDAAD